MSCWLSKDPIGISGGLNQYVFCGNNPVNKRDPFGLCEDDRKERSRLMVESLTWPRSIFDFSWPWLWHGPSGIYDLKVWHRYETFYIGAEPVSADQYGNYLAGFGANYRWGAFGDWGVRRAGL